MRKQEEDEFDLQLDADEPSTDDHLMDQFMQWVTSVDVGDHSARSAWQHRIAVKCIYDKQTK